MAITYLIFGEESTKANFRVANLPVVLTGRSPCRKRQFHLLLATLIISTGTSYFSDTLGGLNGL
jgi:hypothetical protein